MLSPGDWGQVTNNGDKVLRIGWANKTYNIPPGKPTMVPAEAIHCWFGDPRCVDTIKSIHKEDGTVDFVADRATEVRRLRLKYGCYEGDELDFTGAEAFIPQVIVKTLEGEVVPVVINDPYGENVMGVASLGQQSTVDELRKMLQSQQRQMAILQARLDDEGSGVDVSQHAPGILADAIADSVGDTPPADDDDPDRQPPEPREKRVRAGTVKEPANA